ncbi:MAG: HAD hydrolase-like protein [Veillonella caviae]|nr:HAD hydrolase-like protein [Veillonella caviae]
MKKTIIFDLDGTLTDSQEGILKSIEFALNHFGYEVPSYDTLLLFLGPPIVDSLQEHCSMTLEKAEEVYKKFGERYGTIGKFENKLYPNIVDLLGKVKSEQYTVALATAKPEVYAKEILEYFSISDYFNVVVGANYQEGLMHKKDILQKAIELCGNPLTDGNGRRLIYMVGDRKYDVESANELGCISIGVTYGYGTERELNEANAEYLCDDADDIVMTLDLEEMMVRR